MSESEKWWQVMQNYNQAICPLQLFILTAGLLTAFAFILKPNKIRANLIKIYLILCNGWIAVMLFLWPGRDFSSPIKDVQGGLFIAISLLLIFDLIADKTKLALPESGAGQISATAGLLIIFAYPLWELLLGHSTDRLIYPGSFSCPTTALALALVIFAREKKNPALYVLLLIWAIPFPPAVQIPKYRVYEDFIMFGFGIAAFINLVGYNLDCRISLKTDKNNIAAPGKLLIVYGVLKGYLTHPLYFLAGTLCSLPEFLRKHKSDYPADFLKSSGLAALMYIRLQRYMDKDRALEIIRAAVMVLGLSVQQSNFRSVEDDRTFENLISYQQRTNREGPTRLNRMEIIEQCEKRYEFRVTRCLFFEFFSSLGIPELTSLMCSIDNAIFNSYLPELVTFHRKGTYRRIADGAEFCTFVIENNLV